VGDDHETREFSTWAPVAIACIGELPGTIADRSITVSMRRRRPDEVVERLRLDRLDAFQPTASKCARWVVDHSITLATADPEIPGFLHDRAADNWRPLFVIADAAGGHWPERARKAARLLSAGEAADDESIRVMLLADIRTIFGTENADRLSSAVITARLADMEHRPWPEWKNGKAITARQLAKLLAPFGIVPTTIRTGDSTPKGYLLTAFTDAFARYLADDPPLRHNGDEPSTFSKSPSATAASVLRTEDGRKVNIDAHCGGVADRRAGAGEEEAVWTA
jgi:putative DNA primase/helicase